MLAPGTVIDNRYEIVGALGAGGMGQVHRARRLHLGDEVAIKVMRAALDAPSDLRERFLRESRAAAQLRHPHIVSILDFNVLPEGQPYLVMELLSGPSLEEELQLGAMAPAAAAEVVRAVADALQMAHDCGITHRDLKPANIVSHRFASGERVYKVIDFGLAAVEAAAGQTRLTAPHMFLGTLAYAAPEQLQGGPVDPRTDVYALGAVAYQMLTGRRPFDADDGVTLLNQVLTGVPGRPTAVGRGLPAGVDAVLMKALARQPDDRWPTIAAFAGALLASLGAASWVRAAAAGGDALLARYDLGELLGRGRLGSLVYRGTHRALGAAVAIRVLRREEQPHWDAVRARFLLEARTLQVPHAHLLQVKDYGEDDRLVFLVTDLVEGPSLRQELARLGRLPWPMVRSLLGQMLDGAAALHGRSGFIVGVNPDMIRLADDRSGRRVVMSTAGIASVQDVLSTMREQELRGAEASEQELPYIAPEVLMGQGPSPAADVFTIGVLAYQMAAGALPFRAGSLPELIGQMLRMRPADVRTFAPDIPAGAAAAVERALSAEPSSRFPTAHAFAQALGA